jgi:hypothetical protein
LGRILDIYSADLQSLGAEIRSLQFEKSPESFRGILYDGSESLFDVDEEELHRAIKG